MERKRVLHPGEWKYNEIQRWNYGEITKMIGGGVFTARAHRR